MPRVMRKYLDDLAADIERRGNGITEDDIWKAEERLKGVPRETIRVCDTEYLESEVELMIS